MIVIIKHIREYGTYQLSGTVVYISIYVTNDVNGTTSHKLDYVTQPFFHGSSPAIVSMSPTAPNPTTQRRLQYGCWVNINCVTKLISRKLFRISCEYEKITSFTKMARTEEAVQPKIDNAN